MSGTFLAAWIKLRRPALLWGTYGATAAVTALLTSLVFVFAEENGAGRGAPPSTPGGGSSIQTLSEASGLLQGLISSVSIFGIIAFCVAAAVFAGEHSTGTLRNLLIRQPSRWRVLLGTWAAVATFTIGLVIAAAIAAAAVALVLAHGQGVDTAAWSTTDGLETSLRALGEVLIAIIGYATLGSALGTILRSSIPAVAIGFGWLFLIETMIANSADGSRRWLPGQALSIVALNGTERVSLTTALVVAAAYLIVSSGLAATAFSRRDVTA